MPLYNYECNQGHKFESLVRMDLSDEPRYCPISETPAKPCHAPVVRLLSAPAKLFPGADSWRK
jgi:putative FmdB family regulatory protein